MTQEGSIDEGIQCTVNAEEMSLINQNESDDPIQEIPLIGLDSVPCNHLPGCAQDCVLWVQSNMEFASGVLSHWESYVCL